MNADFAKAVKEAIVHPRCKGINIFPTSEGRYQVSIFVDSRNNADVHVDANPMTALYRALVSFERRT
jgi:hypothetical protein